MSGKVLYKPDPTVQGDALIERFIAFVNRTRRLNIDDYQSLWSYSVENSDAFWQDVASFFELHDQANAEVVSTSDSMPGALWFPTTKLNFTRKVLDAQRGNSISIRGCDELGPTRMLSGEELTSEVLRLASYLSASGVKKGDRVAGYISNTPEAAVALLATAAIGAVWSSVGLDYAPQAAAERLAPLDAKVLIVSLTYTYKGEVKNSGENVSQLVSLLPTVSHVISYSQRTPAPSLSFSESGPQVISWSEALEGPLATTEDVEFNSPLWVLFSSGTTGKPKGIVHSQGGVVLELLKMLSFQLDIREDDTFFWFSSPSWVMWNIQVSGLLTGASIVTYDGHPAYPNPKALWDVAEDTRTTFLGVSPAFLDQSRASSEAEQMREIAKKLRGIGTTGAPINPETHAWALDISQGAPVHSISGGTDISSAFAAGALNLPIYAGEISAPALGVSLEAWDADGNAVREEVGELIVKKPMPSMPIMFWDDPHQEKYLEAYFQDFEGVWRHGDWITVTSRGSLIFHGRSDATLNRHGVRLGSSDIYNCVDNFPGVADSLVLGVERADRPYWMPLFVVLEDEVKLTEDYKNSLQEAIKTQVSPRHVPDQIIPISEVPRTLTGKRLEVPLKRILQGAEVGTALQKSAVANPDSIPVFLEIAKEALDVFDVDES